MYSPHTKIHIVEARPEISKIGPVEFQVSFEHPDTRGESADFATRLEAEDFALAEYGENIEIVFHHA